MILWDVLNLFIEMKPFSAVLSFSETNAFSGLCYYFQSYKYKIKHIHINLHSGVLSTLYQNVLTAVIFAGAIYTLTGPQVQYYSHLYIILCMIFKSTSCTSPQIKVIIFLS